MMLGGRIAESIIFNSVTSGMYLPFFFSKVSWQNKNWKW